ncbi:hypothetical protein BN8_01924 [Fibrisoma limi BUZ 3]|uniref:Uncharacterized protein n=1 Tax=Fibrisoma limi BUZ 3 TaxID=1185876 RepID=I2GG60_9BACT|nr:hypothetical protein BN8_01924 [Fibrisoma limi BUZ 3]
MPKKRLVSGGFVWCQVRNLTPHEPTRHRDVTLPSNKKVNE